MVALPPDRLRPMLATAARTPPSGPGWAWELKWDGIRALARIGDLRVRLFGRNGNEIADRYPEIRGLADQLGGRSAVLDGELVAFDRAGRPSFQLLQRRVHVTGTRAIDALAGEVPVVYVVFDLLELDGRSTRDLPYLQRRSKLSGLHLEGPAWRVPPHERGDGRAMLDVSRRFGLEGVMAKRADSAYEAGRRSTSWMKVKHHRRQELVVGGWMPGTGARGATLGSLLVGYYDDTGELRYAGRVGTGFTEADLEHLRTALAGIERATSPFTGTGLPKEAVFVEPRLVVEVRFGEWTGAGRVRQPVFLGTRTDKDPREVRREG